MQQSVENALLDVSITGNAEKAEGMKTLYRYIETILVAEAEGGTMNKVCDHSIKRRTQPSS